MAKRSVNKEFNDFMLEVAKGDVEGHVHINKFGRNSLITTASDPEDIWDGGGVYSPPTTARIHNIVSTSAQDAGTVLSTGTITTVSTTEVIDENATFVTDGVSVHDIYLNDDTQDHSLVESVESVFKSPLSMLSLKKQSKPSSIVDFPISFFPIIQVKSLTLIDTGSL